MGPVHHRGGEQQTCPDQVPGRRLTAIGDDGERLVAIGHADVPGHLTQPIDEIAGFGTGSRIRRQGGRGRFGDLHDPVTRSRPDCPKQEAATAPAATTPLRIEAGL